MIRAAAPIAIATSTKGVNGMSISVRSNDQRSTEELMIELGDAGIAKLLMRRFQLLEPVEEFLRRPCNGIMFAALALSWTSSATGSKRTSASANSVPFFLARGLR
jgi:hypothetical protein